jgi:hypothetical protein
LAHLFIFNGKEWGVGNTERKRERKDPEECERRSVAEKVWVINLTIDQVIYEGQRKG